MSKTDIISFENVNKMFETDEGQNEVLSGVNLKIEQGKIFGIIGYSGAGKSTLIRCINGLELPTSGSIKYLDTVVNELSEKGLINLRSEISMIFQQFNLMPQRTIAENVALPIKYKKIGKKQTAAKVDELLSLVGLSDKADAYPNSLSGGQKQRVAIARALINDPKVLLCDEATSALDPETTDSILEILKELNQKLNITVVVVTHEMKVIEQICEDVAVLHNGRIVETGNVYDVFSHPKEEITKRFVKTTTNLNVSKGLYQALGLPEGHRLIRVTYNNENTIDPVISLVSRKYNVDISILLGDIKLIQGKLIGGLIISVEGNEEDIENAYKELKLNIGIEVEVINDVE